MFRKSMYELKNLLIRADVSGGCRLSITFDNPRDTAFFERELRRELAAERMIPDGIITSLDELVIYGIRVRII